MCVLLTTEEHAQRHNHEGHHCFWYTIPGVSALPVLPPALPVCLLPFLSLLLLLLRLRRHQVGMRSQSYTVSTSACIMLIMLSSESPLLKRGTWYVNPHKAFILIKLWLTHTSRQQQQACKATDWIGQAISQPIGTVYHTDRKRACVCRCARHCATQSKTSFTKWV